MGNTIGLNFNDNGHMGVNIKLYIFLCIMGPFNTMDLETEPYALDITNPSPHNLLINIFLFFLLSIKYNSILTNAGLAPLVIYI